MIKIASNLLFVSAQYIVAVAAIPSGRLVYIKLYIISVSHVHASMMGSTLYCICTAAYNVLWFAYEHVIMVELDLVHS